MTDNLSTWLVLLGLSINGFFTGLGVVVANFFFDYYIKPKIKKIRKVIRRI